MFARFQRSQLLVWGEAEDWNVTEGVVWTFGLLENLNFLLFCVTWISFEYKKTHFLGLFSWPDCMNVRCETPGKSCFWENARRTRSMPSCGDCDEEVIKRKVKAAQRINFYKTSDFIAVPAGGYARVVFRLRKIWQKLLFAVGIITALWG